MAYADGEAGGKQYQPHASIRGHLAPEDEHAGGETRLELDGLARAEQPRAAVAAEPRQVPEHDGACAAARVTPRPTL